MGSVQFSFVSSVHFYSALFSFAQFCFVLFRFSVSVLFVSFRLSSALVCGVQFNFVRSCSFFSVLFWFVNFCSVLLCFFVGSALFFWVPFCCSVRFVLVLSGSVLFFVVLFCSGMSQLGSIQFCSVLLPVLISNARLGTNARGNSVSINRM